MKRFVSIFVLLFMIGIVSATVPEDCDANMVSYWQFDGDSNDLVGGNNLVLSGGPSFSSGKLGNSLEITLDSEYFQISSIPSNLQFSSSDDFTIEGWVNLNVMSHSLGVYIGALSGATKMYSLNVNSDNTLSFYWNNVEVVSSGASTVSIGGWTYIAVTKQGSTFKLYIGDSEVGSGTSTDNPSYSGVALYGGMIGDGLIDEVAIYNSFRNPSTDYSISNSGNDYCYVAPQGGGDLVGDASEVQTEFEIPGCVHEIADGGCNRNFFPDGYYPFYCADSDEQGVFEGESSLPDAVPNACLWESGSGGRLPCCPSSFECRDDDSDGNAYCVSADFDCAYWETLEDCHADGRNCIWRILDETSGECVDPDLFTCADYKDNESCIEDPYYVGLYDPTGSCSGEGIDELGLVSISEGCSWSETEQKCSYRCGVYSSIGEEVSLTCSVFDSEIGECIDGERIFSWTSEATFEGTLPEGMNLTEFLKEKNCINGTEVIPCGAALVRLPGFGWFNILSIVVILAVFYYLFRKDFKKHL